MVDSIISMDDRNIYRLAEALKNNTSLQSLQIDTNGISKSSWPPLQDALKITKTLKTLSYKKLHVSNIHWISDVIKNNNSLDTLELSDIRDIYDDEEILNISQAIGENKHLKNLQLQYFNSFQTPGFVILFHLGKTLEMNKTLLSLDISYNQMGNYNNFNSKERENAPDWYFDETQDKFVDRKPGVGFVTSFIMAIQNFADGLRKNTTLQTLNLTGNNIGNEGAIALAEAIKINKTLTYINLSKNSIGEEGCLALKDAIRGKNNLLLDQGVNPKFSKLSQDEVFENKPPNTVYTDIEPVGSENPTRFNFYSGSEDETQVGYASKDPNSDDEWYVFWFFVVIL